MLPFIRRVHTRRYAINNTLYGVAKVSVPYEYPKNYPQGHYHPLMVIGGFPDVDDEDMRRTFEPSGPRGSLLNEWFIKAKLERGRFPLLHAFRYRPVRNDPRRFFAKRDSGKNVCVDLCPFEKLALLAQFRSELDSLKDAILDFRPEVVVTLGPLALWAILNNDKPIDHFISQPNGYTCTLEHKKQRVSFILIPAYDPSTFLITNDTQFEDISLRAFKAAQRILRPASG